MKIRIYHNSRRSRHEEFTDIENQILFLMIKGYEYKSIAFELGISPLDVENGIKSMAKKVREPTMREVMIMLDQLRPKILDEMFSPLGSRSVH